MVIESQLQSLNCNDFTKPVNSDKLLLAGKAKYLGPWVGYDWSCDDYILELCRNIYYYSHMFRRLRKTLPSQLFLDIYKSYLYNQRSMIGSLFEIMIQKLTQIVYNELRI